MPIYEYRCPDGHIHERIRRHLERQNPSPCPTCHADTTVLFSAHHKQPDGLYSYDPPLGDPAKFERNLAGIEKLKARIGEKKDRGHPR